MTEQEWLECEDPQRMLYHLCGGSEGLEGNAELWRTTSRKLRLFACGCCRNMLGRWVPYRGRVADLVAVAESVADSILESKDRSKAFNQADNIDGPPGTYIRGCLRGNAACGAYELASEPVDFEGEISTAQAHLLRDIIGNPFRPIYWADDPKRHAEPYTGPSKRPNPQDVPHLDMRRSWLTPTVVSLAQAAYEEREAVECKECDGKGGRWDTEAIDQWYRCDRCHGTGRIQTGHLDPVRLAVLADALEEAGCNVGWVHEHKDNATHYWYNDAFGKQWPHLTPDRAAEHPVIAHLRSPGPHWRGCWAIDLLTNKE